MRGVDPRAFYLCQQLIVAENPRSFLDERNIFPDARSVDAPVGAGGRFKEIGFLYLVKAFKQFNNIIDSLNDNVAIPMAIDRGVDPSAHRVKPPPPRIRRGRKSVFK